MMNRHKVNSYFILLETVSVVDYYTVFRYSGLLYCTEEGVAAEIEPKKA